MPKDMSADTRIEAVAGKSVELPNGNFVANAEMTRSGMDLHLTGPGGHTIIVEGYFAQMPSPDLVTHDGARLTPAMVNAFVPPEHVGQYAASGQIVNDASPAGKITQVVGEAHIIHADGTKVLATVGALIFQGDVVETSKTGAVNIQFADNTTFAISESARMSVDQFVYHSADHTGSTFFSMLQGVFVYTSGLIGKSDPGSVNIETPVGSIGIRGTVVAGHILPAGQSSQITIVDGAVTLTNGSGTQELNTNLATVSLNSYQAQPATVPMDANTFNSSYHSVSSVASDTLNHFTGMTAPAGEHAPTSTAPAATGSGTATAPMTTAPASSTTTHAPAAAPAAPAPAAPTGSAAPAPSSTDTTQAAANTAPAATTTAPAPAVTDAATAPPPPASTASTFGSGSTASGTSDTASSAGTFAAPPANSTAGTSSASSTTTAPTSTETAPATGTTTTSTNTPPAGTGTTGPTPLQLAVSAAQASATAASNVADAATANAATVHADAVAAANSATTAQAAATAAAANSATDPTDAAAAQSSATAATALATVAHNADVDATAQATAAHNAATSATNAYQAALAATDAPTAQSAAATAATYVTVAQAAATAAAADLTSTAAATASAATDATQAQTSQGLVAAVVSEALSAAVSAAQASVTAAHTADVTAIANAATAHADAVAAAASYTAAQTAATTAAANSATDSTDATAAQTAANTASTAANAASAADTAAAAQVTAANTAYANAQAALALAQAETNPVTAQTDVTNAANAYTAANTAANNVSVDLANALAGSQTAATNQTAAQTSEGLVAAAVTTALAAAVTTATTAVAAALTAEQNATAYANNANASYTTASTDATTVSNAYTAASTPGSGAFTSDVSTLLTANTSAQNALSNANTANTASATQLSNAQAAYSAAQTALATAETAQTALNVSGAQAAATAATGDATTAANAATAANGDMTSASNDASTAATAVTTATGFRLDNIFSTAYTNNTPGTTLDDGVKEFATAGTVISQITPVNSGADAISYTVTVLSNNSPVEVLSGGSLTSITGSTNAFSINSSGQLIVDNPLALDGYYNQSGIMINIAATDQSTSATVNEQLLIQIHNQPSLDLFPTEVQGPASIVTQMNYAASTNDAFIIGSGAAGQMLSDGGFTQDVIIGNNAGDTIVVSNNAFQYINGGAGGLNTLQLATPAPQMWDFTNATSMGTVTNIQDISLSTSGSSITLDNQNIASITGETSNPMLVVDTSQGSIIINNTLGTSNMAYSMSLFDGQDGVFGGRTVPGSGFGLLFSDAAGDNLVVTPDASGNGGGGTGSESGAGIGAAVQFSVASSTNPLTADDDAGFRVGISGNNVIMGAQHYADSGLTNSGIAYIENMATDAITVLKPTTPIANTDFGYSVAVGGNIAVVGAPAVDGGNNGGAYIFNASTDVEQLQINTTSLSLTTSAEFGSSVATDGNNIVIGAANESATGEAYIFDSSGTYIATLSTAGLSLTTGADFGLSTAISGNTVVVGAMEANGGAGGAYVYNAAGTYEYTLSDPNATAGNGLFGGTVAVSGNTIVVGASQETVGGHAYAGAVYVYNATTGALEYTIAGTAGQELGESVSISGNTIVVGEESHTNAFVYDATTGALIATLSDPNGGSTTYGTSVGISGNTAVVGAFTDTGGASQSGAAYTYTYATTGAQVTVEGANAGNYTAFQVSDFAGQHSVVGTLGVAGDTYQIIGGDSAHNLISAGGFTTTESSTASSVPFSIVGNQLVVNDPTALFADQAFTLTVENMTTSASTTVAVFSSDPFSPGVMAQGELMDTTSGGQTVTATTSNEIIWGGSGTTGDILTDGGTGAFTGDAFIGSNANNNTINVSNSNFALVDGGTGGGNYLGLLNTTTSTAFNIDFETLSGSVKNIDTINLGYSSFGGVSNGNSVTLNVQDVFDMTNSADNHTLNIIQGNGVSNSAVNVATLNTNASLDFTASPNNGGLGTTQTYTGTYNNTHVTLVIYDAAPSGSDHIAVNHVA